ncbi:MAG: hypothetical protein KatS3mg035_1028 [Bacteroidia bacterium]|nr:MAG: hypothetical protein KatS3mg035_1028 [Bacteroidia bacterium]
MKNSEKIKTLILESKNEAIEALKNEISRLEKMYMNEYEDADEFHGMIEIPRPIIHQYIDDQSNEVISRISTDLSAVYVDTGFDSYRMKIEELDTFQILAILQQLEDIDNASDIELI